MKINRIFVRFLSMSFSHFSGVLFCCFLFSKVALAQPGAYSTYKFLNLPFSARTAALGGNSIAVKDDDIFQSVQNPSLLSSSMDNKTGFSYVNYFSDINYGYTNYVKHVEKVGTFSGGLQFVNYGSFIRADENGLTEGAFKASEYSFNLSYAKQLDSNFSVGSHLKTIYSVLETYTSIGNAIDVAGTYYLPGKNFTATLVFKNIGRQWKTYAGHKEPIPFEIQTGLSFKPKHAPFRISVIGTNLQKWDLTYIDPVLAAQNVDPISGQQITKKKSVIFADKFMRHVIVSGELLITKNFNLRMGYNYQRRQELKLDTRTGMSGFSFGFGLKVYKFQLSYGRARYHLAGVSNHFTISTNLSDFKRKQNG